MIRALLVAIALLGAAPARAQGDEAAFTETIAARFRAGMPGREVAVTGPLQLRISAEGSEPGEVNLDRIWNYCRTASAADCETSTANFIAAIAETLADQPPLTRAQLRIMIRSNDYCVGARRNLPADQSHVTRPGPLGLCLLIVADYPRTMRLVLSSDLAPLGLDAEAIWPIAERQTLAVLPQPQSLTALDQHNAAAVVDHAYIPSLLLDAEGWRSVAARGEILAAVPSDDMLIAVRAADVTDLAAFRATVRQHYEEAERGVSPHVYRWTERGWQPLAD
jgi:hypothetical protein